MDNKLYENIMMRIAKVVKNAINESDEAVAKHGTHRTYYLNMDLNTPKAGRTAPKMSPKELQDKITEYFWKYGADEYDRRDHKEGSKISAGRFLYRMVGNWKDEKKIKQNSKLPEMNIDLLKIYHDTENCDAVGDIRTTKSGIPYILGRMGGDWEEPILFMVYWDGKTFRGYIPERGNQYNRDTKGALGNNEEADEAFIRKQFKDEIENGTEYSKIKKNIRCNKDACIADFEARIKRK